MTSMAPAPSRPGSSSSAESSDLAEVVPGPRGCVIRLPPEFSREAVLELLRREGCTGAVVMGPADISGVGSIGPEQWAIIASPSSLRFLPRVQPIFLLDGLDPKAVFIFPKHTLVLPAAQVWWVRSALEGVKPERLDAEGRPLPWVPAVARSPAPVLETGRDQDALLDDREVLSECPQPVGDDEGAVIATSTIHQWFGQLCAGAGLPEVPLVVRRGQSDARGFVSGRIVMTSGFVPRRIVITTCPNADQAEILATLAHELAHPLARAWDHGPAFCQGLVDLAARLWGEAFFAGARAQVAGPYAVLDRWVTSGVRAALAEREPPSRKVCDDGHAARIVSKVAKLRALAADQLGRPEAIGATAMANDMITVYGLDGSQVSTAPSIDDSMTDRWVLLDARQPWQRSLAHQVAHFNGVYSLSMDAKARMHFFGRYSDVIAAEYLCGISIERIKRECAAHLETLRRSGNLPRGESRRAGVAFCDSAAMEFGRKLRRIAAEESARGAGPTEQSVAFEEAQDFAEEQLDLRGLRVSSGRGRRIRLSPEGVEAGRRMQVVRGLDSQGGAPRQLPGGK